MLKKGKKVMIGKGENSIFIEAGLTPEESRKRLNEKIDRIIKEEKRQENKEQAKKRVLSLLKKNN